MKLYKQHTDNIEEIKAQLSAKKRWHVDLPATLSPHHLLSKETDPVILMNSEEADLYNHYRCNLIHTGDRK